MRTTPLLGLAFCACAAAGCGATGGTIAPQAPSTAPIVHLVYVKLIDPADAPELIADSDATLSTISSVTTYFCGPPLRTGRSNVEADYDVAIGLGFEDLHGYQLYVENPRHVGYVERWKPRCAWIRIHDVADDPAVAGTLDAAPAAPAAH